MKEWKESLGTNQNMTVTLRQSLGNLLCTHWGYGGSPRRFSRGCTVPGVLCDENKCSIHEHHGVWVPLSKGKWHLKSKRQKESFQPCSSKVSKQESDFSLQAQCSQSGPSLEACPKTDRPQKAERPVTWNHLKLTAYTLSVWGTQGYFALALWKGINDRLLQWASF